VVTEPSPVEIDGLEGVHKRDLCIGSCNSGLVLDSGALYLAGQVGGWRGNLFHYVKELSEERVVRVSCYSVNIMVLCGGESVVSLKELCIEHLRRRRRELGRQFEQLPVELKMAILAS